MSRPQLRLCLEGTHHVRCPQAAFMEHGDENTKGLQLIRRCRSTLPSMSRPRLIQRFGASV
jgi:hypothetical protein